MKGAIRILVVSSHYERPGSFTGHPVHKLSLTLVRCGGDVRVLCPLSRFHRPFGAGRSAHATRRAWSVHVDGVPTSYLPYANVPHSISPALDARLLARRLAGAIRSRDWYPEVIHAHRLFPTGDAAVQIGDRFSVPVVVTAHGSDVHTAPARNEMVAARTRSVIESAALVTTVSDDLTSRINWLGRPTVPPQTVHLGVDTEMFTPRDDRSVVRRRLGLPESGVGLISVCRLSSAKGVFDLLEGFEALLVEHPASWLVFLGDGPARSRLEGRVEERGLQRSVFLPGSRPNSQVSEWLQAADISVLASYAEGLPNVVLEAMACGLPVVASNVGGTGEALVDETGILFEPGDTRGLTLALTELASRPDLRSGMGERARNRAKRHFSWDRVADRYMALYAELVPRLAVGGA